MINFHTFEILSTKAILVCCLSILIYTNASAQGACLVCSEWDVRMKHPQINFERSILNDGKVTLTGSLLDITYLYVFVDKQSHSLWLVPKTTAAHRRLLNHYKDYYSPEENTWKEYLDNGAVITIYHIHHEDLGWFFILF